ncbi:MAG: GAF domain-containing protein [Chloroflexi bacterium]|nr:GAF domain-containing protein [Chloroflexota bacterium]
MHRKLPSSTTLLKLQQGLYQEILLAKNPEEVARAAIQYVRQILPVDRATVVFFEAEQATTLITNVDDRTNMPEGTQLLISKRPFINALSHKSFITLNHEDMLSQAAVSSAIASPFDEHIHSMTLIPLWAKGDIIGCLNLGTKQPEGLSSEDIETAVEISKPIAIAIQQVKLLQEIQQRTDELQSQEQFLTLLHEITQLTASIQEFPTVLQSIADNLGKLIGANSCFITLWNEKKQSTMPAAASEPFSNSYRRSTSEQGHKTVTAFVLREERILTIENSYNSPYISPETAQQYEKASILGIPLIAGTQKLGAAVLTFTHPHQITPAEIRRSEQVAAPIALVIAKARLLHREREQRGIAEALQETGKVLNATLKLEGLLDLVLEQIAHVAPYDSANIMLLENGRLRIARQRGYEQYGVSAETLSLSFDVDETPTFRQITQTKQPLIIPDVTTHPGWIWRVPHIRSWAGVPIIIQNRVVALICVDNTTPGFYQPEQINRLIVFANQVALTMQNARLLEAVQRQLGELTILQSLALTSVETLDEDALIRQATDIIGDSFSPYDFGILLLDESKQTLNPHASYHAPNRQLRHPYIPISQGVIGHVIQTGEPCIVSDIANSSYYIEENEAIRSEICVPLRIGSELIGVINAESVHLNAFDETDKNFLMIFSHQLGIAIEKIRLVAETEQRATKLETLSALSSELRAANNIEEMILAILQRSMSIVGGSLGSLYVVDSQTGDMVCQGVYPHKPEMLARRFQKGEGVVGHIAATGEIHTTTNMAQSQRAHFYDQEKQMVDVRQIQSGIGLPLRTQKRIIGILYINLPQVHTFTADEVDFLTAISEIAGGALDRIMLLHSLEERVAARTNELAATNERLKELDRLKSKFISDVSHELRTPITNLSLYLDLFTLGNPEKHARYLSVLRNQTDRLAQLIEDILNLSRLELGERKVEFQPVNLNEIVSVVARSYLPGVQEANLTLLQDLQPNPPSISGEPNQLAQVVSHLLSNAIQYTENGRIHISTSGHNNQIQLQVSDTGIGIHPEDQAHLFDRFYRGKDSSYISGTGLGLAIVKEIIELHQGEITVESQMGEGTTFTVWLPATG